jgi:hypothetical protein
MASTTNEATDVRTDPAVAWVEQKAKGFSKDADDLRASADRAAKALIGLASIGLTAVGIAKVGAVYPWPSDGWDATWVIVLFAGFVLMVTSVVWFVIRFWKATRPLAMSTENATLRYYMNGAELAEVNRIYREAIEHAPFCADQRLLDVVVDDDQPLSTYELLADRWEQEALLSPGSPISGRRLSQVVRIRAEIDRAEQRAKLVLVRRRMTNALTRWPTYVAALLFVVGLLGFAVAADRLESERVIDACLEPFRLDPAASRDASQLPSVCAP